MFHIAIFSFVAKYGVLQNRPLIMWYCLIFINKSNRGQSRFIRSIQTGNNIVYLALWHETRNLIVIETGFFSDQISLEV